jgi:hypothetical protein
MWMLQRQRNRLRSSCEGKRRKGRQSNLGQVSVGAMLWLVISFPKTEKDQGKRQI